MSSLADRAGRPSSTRSQRLARFRRIATFTFHGVGEPPRHLEDGEAATWLSRDSFEAALDALSGTGARLTVDDANASDAEVVLPCLVERSLRATFFVVAGRLDQPGFLSREQLRELVRAGMRVGTHGLHHVDWRTLPTDALREELLVSRDAIESVAGETVDTASCPFGSYDRRVLAILRGCGFRSVFTSDGGRSRPGGWLQRRTTVRSDSDLAQLVRLAAAREPLVDEGLRFAKQLAKRIR